MKTNNKKAGLYIHVPFCSKKCNYCDFYSFSANDELKSDYVNALIKHSGIVASKMGNTEFDSVFIGGGTPTALGTSLLSKLIEGIKENLKIQENAEFSVETNPGLCEASDFKSLASLGVNRVSIGLQSADENELKVLGRIHSTDDYLRTLDAVRNAGIYNINTDIMFSLPSQDSKTLAKTLDFVSAAKPTHISAYSLKIEDGTPFAKMQNTLDLPDEDADADMYQQICDTLASYGYTHYEISNFSLPDYECKHNLKYWKLDDYIGLGPAAHSSVGSFRYGYSRDINAYVNKFLNGDDINILSESSSLSTEDRDRERIMLGLRLSEGISFDSLYRIADKNIAEKNIRNLLDCGLIKTTSNGFALTERGMYVSNSIINLFI